MVFLPAIVGSLEQRVTWDAEGKEGKGGMKCRTEVKGQHMGIDLPLHEPGKGICVI